MPKTKSRSRQSRRDGELLNESLTEIEGAICMGSRGRGYHLKRAILLIGCKVLGAHTLISIFPSSLARHFREEDSGYQIRRWENTIYMHIYTYISHAGLEKSKPGPAETVDADANAFSSR